MRLRHGSAAGEESLRDLIGARFLTLHEHARTIIECAALLGYRFDVLALTASTGVSARRTHAALRRAQSLDLVVAEPGDASRYRFRHDLTRAAVRQQIDPQRRKTLHAMIAEALETLPDAVTRSEQLAHHWEAAGDALRAALYSERAVQEARLLGLGS